MNWNTESVTSTFDYTQPASGMINDRTSQRQGSNVGTHQVEDGTTGMWWWKETKYKDVSNLPENSIVGINVTQVPAMREAIENYCGEIETYLRDLDPTADATVAFKSEEVQKALLTYMDVVKTYCLNLVSQLRAFSDKLADVYNQWQVSTGNMASSINSTSGNAFASGSTYSSSVELNSQP